MASKSYYICSGSVRGQCAHQHRTLEGAAKCLRRDVDGCASQGGYSDRRIARVVDDVRESIDEEDSDLVDAIVNRTLYGTVAS